MADDYPAAPQPTPKHFTDEELKQQYGIHLATRLQADADGKESKWADIDDDEDDWAPETIEWNDGTKIDLSQNNQAAILAEEQARALVEKERQEEEQRKAKLAAQQKTTTTVGPNATILKPRSAGQPKTGGIVLKTSTDKPTLVAKPTAPAPVRSPWASLPPVDKVPPVEINPPTQLPTFRPQPPESYSSHTTAVPPPPAMEIAADDFTRTRRDTQNGNLGQLYNAQSGQYEPANAGRRGSVRKDQSFRPPSVLQRGSQHESHGPAEPSPAFQTQRTSSQQDHPPWTRRGSSVVSGDSGPQGRRASMGKGSDMSKVPVDVLQQRRESQPLVSPSTPSTKQEQQIPSAVQSPALHQSQIVQDARSATGSPYQSKVIPHDVAASAQAEEVAAMKALMKEKVENARKRRKEEEEREEAAKKERIRIKMEKLGMAPLEEKVEKKEPEKKQIEKRVIDHVQPEAKDLEKPETKADASKASVNTQKPLDLVSRSPPKPPVPDSSGASQQYGMMRVHGAQPTSVIEAPEIPAVDKTKSQPSSQKPSPPGLEPKTEANESLSSPMLNGVVNSQKYADVPSYKVAENQLHTASREHKQQAWNLSHRDQNAYGGWNPQNVPMEATVSSSVWGPTSHSRTLGNGMFDRSIQRPQSRLQDQFASPALAPIGPPRHLQRPRETAELRTNNISPAPLAEDIQTIPTFPPSEAPVPSSGKADSLGRHGTVNNQISAPKAAIGAHLRPQRNQVERHTRDLDQQQAASLTAWGNFKNVEAEERRQAIQEHAAKLAEDARNGIIRPEPQPQLPIMNETWRQVKVDREGTQRQVVGVAKSQNNHDRPLAHPSNADTRSPSIMGPIGVQPVSTTGQGRGSRFFPAAGTVLQPQFHGTARFPPPGYRRSSSPPPPEDEFHYHPAYTRDPTLPSVKVNLPFSNVTSTSEDTTPKVRLPPTVMTPGHSPQLSQVRAMPIRAASQPLVNNPSWQDRFNGLLGVKKSSPETKFVHVVEGFSTTKVPLDLPSNKVSASVSLPPQNDESINRVFDPASKPVEEEEALFENREFGSLPAVNIPAKAPEIGWQDAKALKRGQSKQSRLSKEVESASKEIFLEKEMIVNGNLLVFINMFGMGGPKSLPIPLSNATNITHGASRHRNFSGNTKPAKGYKPRESAGNYGHNVKNNQGPPPVSSPQGVSHPIPRGQQTKARPAWGPRTATAVH